MNPELGEYRQEMCHAKAEADESFSGFLVQSWSEEALEEAVEAHDRLIRLLQKQHEREVLAEQTRQDLAELETTEE